MAGVFALIAACSVDNAMPRTEYFARVGNLAATLEAVPPGTSGADESSLRAFVVALDGLRPADDARQAHHDLAVASRNLADEVKREPMAYAGSMFTRDWEMACHLLQDVALAKKINVDLRCATALHRG